MSHNIIKLTSVAHRRNFVYHLKLVLEQKLESRDQKLEK